MIKERAKHIWHRAARLLCTTLTYIFYRMRTYGTENVPKTGPLLLLSNHQSYLDPMFCQSIIWRNFYFVARDSLFKIKFLGSLIGSLQTIPIKRDSADISAVRSVIKILKQNCAVCLFPEATRTANGKIADIKPGFGLLSRRAKAKVVPVVIDGAFESWPRHRKFPRPRRVTVCYGKPITPEEIKELGDKEFARILTIRLREMQNDCRVRQGKKPFDYSDALP